MRRWPGPRCWRTQSRMRVRLSFERTTPDEMLETLRHVLVKAGNAKLMTAELMTMLVEHSTGNYRTLMTMAGELLAVGAQREVKQLDEKLYFEVERSRFAAEVKPEA